ncbi:MAG: FG-GAP-like repeat-containing protein [Actinomycetota bacterium]
MRTLLTIATALAFAASVVATAPPVPAQPATPAPSDFNGDGYSDIATPTQPQLSQQATITVMYGGPGGPDPSLTQVIVEDDIAPAAPGELAVAIDKPWGDFDGDGFDDLLVAKRRRLFAVFGTGEGLDPSTWSQISMPPGFTNWTIAVGDVDGDGYDDLVVGDDTDDDVGQLVIFSGTPDGIRTDEAAGAIETGASQGVGPASSIDIGDVNGDGQADIVVGRRDSTVAGVELAGVVDVLLGDGGSFDYDAVQRFSQAGPVRGAPQFKDRFGASVAVDDFDGDGFDDVAVAVPWEDLAGVTSAGAANVLYGSADGITTDGNQIWHQGRGVRGKIERIDRIGSRAGVVTGDFDADGRADLIIDATLEDVGTRRNAGGANLIYGSADGLTAFGDQFWSQRGDRTGGDIPGSPQASDLFGWSIVALDVNGDGFDDAVFSVHLEDLAGVRNAGAFNVVYGGPDGLTGEGAQLWSRLNDGSGLPLARGEQYSAPRGS